MKEEPAADDDIPFTHHKALLKKLRGSKSDEWNHQNPYFRKKKVRGSKSDKWNHENPSVRRTVVKCEDSDPKVLFSYPATDSQE